MKKLSHGTTISISRIGIILLGAAVAQLGTAAFVPSHQRCESVSRAHIPSSIRPWMAKNPWENIFPNPKTNASEAGDKASGKSPPSTTTTSSKNNNNNKKKTPSTTLPFLETLGLGIVRGEEAPTPKPPPLPPSAIPDQSLKRASSPSSLNSSSTLTKDTKFDFVQRIESIKAAALGAVSGSVGIAPIALFHYATTSFAQWELTTDMAALQGALFAIVFRYASRKGDDNPMLDQGVLGAFVLVRTLPVIQASPECTALPLSCGAPIGYFNWSMLNQAVVQGVESAALFGSVYLALEYAFDKGWISKFD